MRLETIGFIGIGNVGSNLTNNLLKSNNNVFVYDKNNLTLITQFDSDNGPDWSTQNLVAKDGMVYVAINNGFEWNNEKGYIGVIDANNLTYINEFDLGENGSNPDNMVIKGDYILTVNNKNWSGSSVSRINFSVGLIFSEAFPRGGRFARFKRVLKELKGTLF